MKYSVMLAIALLTACGQFKGDPGVNGLDGAPGIQGAAGATGSTGAIGATGPTGGMCVVTIPPGHHNVTLNNQCEVIE